MANLVALDVVHCECPLDAAVSHQKISFLACLQQEAFGSLAALLSVEPSIGELEQTRTALRAATYFLPFCNTSRI
jgi:hypothetical protein